MVSTYLPRSLTLGSFSLELSKHITKIIIELELFNVTELFHRSLCFEEVAMALSAVSKFSDVSSLKLNLKKCEILSVNNNDLTEICGIPVKDSVTYLGIKISKDPEEVMNKNFWLVVEAIKKKFNCWLIQDLRKAEDVKSCLYVLITRCLQVFMFQTRQAPF